MNSRLNYFAAAPEVVKAMMALDDSARTMTIPLALRELVKMRCSQINGCAYCLDIHAPAARAAGVSQQKLDVLAAWRESPIFDARERAALAWAEALTRIEATGVPDEDYEALAAVFDGREQTEITMVTTTINAWNRLGITSRMEPGSLDAAYGLNKANLE